MTCVRQTVWTERSGLSEGSSLGEVVIAGTCTWRSCHTSAGPAAGSVIIVILVVGLFIIATYRSDVRRWADDGHAAE